jgi:hypothetical protein
MMEVHINSLLHATMNVLAHPAAAAVENIKWLQFV